MTTAGKLIDQLVESKMIQDLKKSLRDWRKGQNLILLKSDPDMVKYSASDDAAGNKARKELENKFSNEIKKGKIHISGKGKIVTIFQGRKPNFKGFGDVAKKVPMGSEPLWKFKK